MREHGYVDAEVALSAADVIRVKHQNGKTRELIVVRPYQTVFHALQTMQKQDISQLPVFEEDNHPSAPSSKIRSSISPCREKICANSSSAK